MEILRPNGFLQYHRIKRLYRRAFPKCERKPFSIIKEMSAKGKSDIWYFSDKDGFAGLITTINGSDTVLIDYLAVNEKRRGQGLGSEMLRLFFEKYSDFGIFLEIERPDESAKNNGERLRRREFYLRAGLTPMNTYAKLFGVDMELLGLNCQLDFDSYRNFYLKNYGKFAYDHISKI